MYTYRVEIKNKQKIYFEIRAFLSFEQGNLTEIGV